LRPKSIESGLSVKPTKGATGLSHPMINTWVRQEKIMKPSTHKTYGIMRSYRMSHSLAHSLYALARSRNLSESEFVRMILMDTMDKLN